MVFVHSRNDTYKTAKRYIEYIQEYQVKPFASEKNSDYYLSLVNKSRNQQLRDLAPHGIGIHHAGMIRSDRNLVEKLFEEGFLKILICTATLAWGVNLPAHAVIIKGTQVYNAQSGGFTDLGILDVLQIFGRAGKAYNCF
jgi:replicative superfamily II helicase